MTLTHDIFLTQSWLRIGVFPAEEKCISWSENRLSKRRDVNTHSMFPKRIFFASSFLSCLSMILFSFLIQRSDLFHFNNTADKTWAKGKSGTWAKLRFALAFISVSLVLASMLVQRWDLINFKSACDESKLRSRERTVNYALPQYSLLSPWS